MKQVTPLVRDQLAADYRAGIGIYELARKHGLHRYTVSQHLSAAGVVMRRTITDAEKTKAQELYTAGAMYPEIARQLKRDPATVSFKSEAHRHKVECPKCEGGSYGLER